MRVQTNDHSRLNITSFGSGEHLIVSLSVAVESSIDSFSLKQEM